MQDANKRAMVDVAESVDRLKKGSYASPDAFLSALLLTVAKLNSALLKAAQESGHFASFEIATHDVLTEVIRDLIDATRQNAEKFGASGWTVSFAGWPPAFGVTLSGSR